MLTLYVNTISSHRTASAGVYTALHCVYNYVVYKQQSTTTINKRQSTNVTMEMMSTKMAVPTVLLMSAEMESSTTMVQNNATMVTQILMMVVLLLASLNALSSALRLMLLTPARALSLDT